MALIRPCSTSAGFNAIPESTRSVRMRDLKQILAANGYTIVVDASVILLVEKGIESSIYRNGKVLLKTTDEAEAHAAYEELRPFLEATW